MTAPSTQSTQVNRGVYPVVPSPLHSDESIDFEALESCIDYYFDAGTQGVLVLGSGGELPYFNESEQLDIIRSAGKKRRRDQNLIVGVDAFSAKQALGKIESYAPHADAVLLLLNAYYEGGFTEYKQAIALVAAHSPLPVLFYYFPQVTKMSLTAEQIAELLEIPNIIGMKDSSVNLRNTRKILKRVPHTQYFSGLSLLLEEIVPAGASGAMCPLAAISPREVAAHYEKIAVCDANIVSNTSLQQLLPLVNVLGLPATLQAMVLNVLSRLPVSLMKSVSSPHAATKEALRLLGLPVNPFVRSPLKGLSASDSVRIKQCLASAGLV